MPLPAGVETVTVSTGGVPLTLPDGSFVQGSFYFDGPNVATIAGEDLLFGGTVKADLVDGEFSVTLVATDATGVSPSGGTYTVRAALSNAPSWTRYISLPKATPSVVLADVIVADPVAGSYSTLVEAASLAAMYLALAGGTMTGDLTLDGANLSVQRADGTGGFRQRVTGGGLDFEIGGLDVTVSVWSGADYTGTQSYVMRWEPAGPHLVGRTQFGTTPYDEVHVIDAGTGTAGLGAKNSLVNINFCGRLATAGAPSTGTWATGDTVQDAAGALWLCTVGGTPGTWVGGSASKSWVFDVTDSAYGAVGDGQLVTDGAVGAAGTTLTCASGPFTAEDAGKAILVKGAAATGVTSHVTTIASVTSATQVELTDAAVTAVSGALVIWGTDDQAAIQAAVDAAEAYLDAGNTYAEVYFPPLAYILASVLNTAKSGNGHLVFGPRATSGNKKILAFVGATDGAAAVRHWQQTVPQFAGSCLISFHVYASTAAQTADINSNGNPHIICGPNEASGYGVNSGGAVFSNMMAVAKNLALLNAHSAYGLTIGPAGFWGCANAYVENIGWSTVGTVASPSTDYSSPGQFGTGLSVGLMLPAPGNNDHVVVRNVTCGGGYTYGSFLTEHTAVEGRYTALYCWAGAVVVGTYAGSVGSVHSIHLGSASIEACTRELYVYGAGSSGVGPTVYGNISTESSTPSVAGSSTAAMNAALGRIVLTGLFTESGVSVSAPTGLELVDGQVPRAIKRKTGAFTCSPIDRVLVCDTTTAGFTGTLPDASFCPVEYVFRNVGVNALTVASTSSQPIYLADGTSATSTALANGGSLRVQAMYDGTAWGWYAI